MELIALIAFFAAIVLVRIRLKEEKIYIKFLVTVLYTLLFAVSYFFSRQATIFLRGDFKEGANYFIWICCLIGAFAYFPKFEKEKRQRSCPVLVLGEAGQLLVFVAIMILGFCTQELERIYVPCQIAGPCIILVFMAIAALRYYFSAKERALDLRDIMTLFLLSGIYYVFGFVICYRNTFNQAPYIFYNVMILFVVFLLLLFITANMNITVIIGAIVNTVWILAHYFVYQCRGSIFVPNDIRSIGTATTVVKQYEFFINSDIWRLCAFSLAIIIIAVNYKKVYVMKKRKAFSISGTLILSLLVTGWYQSDFIANMNLPYESFKQDTFYDLVGQTLGFIEIMKKTKVEQPEGYSEDTIRQLAQEYSDVGEAAEVQPDIIVIMNETFADIADLGEINTNIDYMPYYHSLTTDKDTAVGRTLVSVYGGNTCQSEYEFLTGNSLEFASEIFPYATEIHGDIYSLVSTLKSQGYHTIATHPNVETNWKRNVIYRYMQFDERYFIEDYENPELVRNYVSDREIYNKALSWLDEGDSAGPQFIFAVTMQNHGSYTGEPLREGEELKIVRQGVDDPEPVDEFLSLIYESDIALEELINKVDKREKPTIVVMFGDHFPRLEDAFWEPLEDKNDQRSELERFQDRYATPYIVHANFDIDVSQIPEYMSVNYLAANVLKASGLKMTSYDNYLLDMQKDIPALNAYGFLSKEGIWYLYSEDYPEEYREKLAEYNNLQYNIRYKDALPEMFAVQ